jgi:hypothetical protein
MHSAKRVAPAVLAVVTAALLIGLAFWAGDDPHARLGPWALVIAIGVLIGALLTKAPKQRPDTRIAFLLSGLGGLLSGIALQSSSGHWGWGLFGLVMAGAGLVLYVRSGAGTRVRD